LLMCVTFIQISTLALVGLSDMQNGHVLTLGILSFALMLSGCGAYEQAQEAARRDLQKAEDQRQFAEDANEAIMHLGSFYVNYHRQNSESPANLDELLGVSTNKEQRAAAATEIIQRMIDAGEITVDWNVDLTAWQASGQDLKQYRLAWLTSKNSQLYADGAGMIRT